MDKEKSKKENKIGILGYGEVGRAIARLCSSVQSAQIKIKDLNKDDGLEGVEILHICIPWNKNFIKIVVREIKKIRPKLVIIHSTVAPGTTKKILSDLPRSYRNVVHSPIRGIHPYLYKGIKTFVKYIGADNKKAGKTAKKHLESLGVKTKLFYPSVTTELGKILDTSYYGLCIAWHGEMKEICEELKVDFEKVATDFNKTYNEGYLKLGKPNVVRPVLYPPKGAIGGHCVVPNAKILKKCHKSKALELIFKYT